MIKLCAFSDEADGSIMGQINALKRNNITYTELRSINGKNVIDFSLDEAREYMQIFSENGIKIWSIGSPLGKVDVNSDEKYNIDRVDYCCKLAKIFNTDKIRIFSFFNSFESRDKVFKHLKNMVKKASEYGVSLYHENEKGIYGDIVERVLELKQNVKDLKFVYDPANYIQCNQNMEVALKKVFNITSYFHIKDVISETGELVPSGFGDGLIEQLINKISDEKVLSIEPHLAIFDAYKNIDDTELKTKFSYKSNTEAFDVAVNSLKKILKKCGYKEENNGDFIK